MAYARSTALLSHVRTLFRAGVAAGLSDAELLEMNDVLRAAVAFKLKACAAVLLAVALAGVAAPGAGVAAGAQKQPGERGSGRVRAVASRLDMVQPGKQRPADEIVQEIEALLKTARRPLPTDEHNATHNRIAVLVDELRNAYPDDPRVTTYVPERWHALSYTQRKAEAVAEVRGILETTTDPLLRKEAQFFDSILKFMGPIDAATAVALANDFARQAPGDNRASELFYQAADKLQAGWYTRVGLFLTFALAGALVATTAGARKWLKLVFRMGELVLLAFVVFVCGFKLFANDSLTAFIRFLHDKFNDSATQQTVLIASWLLSDALQQLRSQGTEYPLAPVFPGPRQSAHRIGRTDQRFLRIVGH